MRRRMDSRNLIATLAITRLWLMIGCCTTILCSPSYGWQNPALKQTRDPYFNPKIQQPATGSLRGPDARITNPLFEKKLEPLAPDSPPVAEQSSASIASQDPNGIKQLRVWVPPVAKKKAVPSTSTGTDPAPPNSAMGTSRLSELKPIPSASNPVTGASPAAPSSSSIIRSAPTERKVVGDFSADLSQLKRNPAPGGSFPNPVAPDSNQFRPQTSDFGLKNGLKPQDPTSDPALAGSAVQPAAPAAPAAPTATTPIPTQPGTSEFIPQPSSRPAGIGTQMGAKPIQDKPVSSAESISKSSGAAEPKSSPAAPVAAETAVSASVSTESLRTRTTPDNLEPTRLMAMVGNEPIFVGDMMFELNQMIERHLAGAPEEIKNRERQNGLKLLLNKYIDSKLLYVDTIRKLPEGADVNKIIEQASKEFDKSAAPAMMKESGIASLADFDAHLRMQGTSLRLLRLSWSKDQLTRYFMSQELEVDKKEVTHQELLEEYQKHVDQYAIPAKARWEQISVRFDRTASREEAERLLVEMGNKIVHGANFASVAKKGSHGYTADKGGLHDWIGKGELAAKELDEAIFSIEVGKLSDKIETADGFHIIRVLERTEATRTPFVEAQVKIKERLLDQKRAAAFEEHLKKLRQEIPVVRYDQDPPANAIRVAERSE